MVGHLLYHNDRHDQEQLRILCWKLNSSHGLQVKTGDSTEAKYVDE